MLIPYDLKLFLYPGYPGWVKVLSWILMVLLLLLSFAIMVGRSKSISDYPDLH